MTKYSFWIYTIIVLVACNRNKSDEKKDFSTKSQHFLIEKNDEITLLKVVEPWPGSEDTVIYILSDTAFNGSRTPKKVVCLSSSVTIYLEELGCDHTIVGIDNVNYAFNSKLINKVAQKKVIEVGGVDRLDVEKLLNLDPDAVFTYASKDNTALQRIIDYGIPVFFVPEYLETHPLGRVEWLKFFGEIFNKQSLANQRYESVASAYQRLKDSVAHITKDKPHVLIGRDYAGNWYVPGGKSYMAQLVKDAGGKYTFEQNEKKGSFPVSFENVLLKTSENDVWLCNSVGWETRSEIVADDKRYGYIPAYKNERVYNNDRNLNQFGANEIFYSAIVHPEKVLKDLICIFHESKCDTMSYYRKVE